MRVWAGALAVAAATLMAACGAPDEPATEIEPTRTAPSGDVSPVPLVDLGAKLVKIPNGPDWFASGFGSLWLKRDDGVVVRLSAQGKVQATIDAGVYEPPVCQGLGVSEEAVWACATSGTLVRVDPRTNEVAATVDVPKINEQGRLPSWRGHVWLLAGDGDEIVGLSEQDHRLTDPIDLGTFCTDVADRVDGSELWVACAHEGRLLRVDLAKREVTATVTKLPLVSNVSVGKRVWAGFEKGLAMIEAESLEVTIVPDVQPSGGGSLRAIGDSLWVREHGGNFLTRLDESSGSVEEIITSDELKSGGDVIEFKGALWSTAYDDDALVHLAD